MARGGAPKREMFLALYYIYNNISLYNSTSFIYLLQPQLIPCSPLQTITSSIYHPSSSSSSFGPIDSSWECELGGPCSAMNFLMFSGVQRGKSSAKSDPGTGEVGHNDDG